ncbi:peptidoglycan bridge formation glycyltransferase FemA/FemB family protein [Candidatus Gracilibacteria bacterium]|nr:peptidoglycan bridge formation glycyltransferase FemA/FemB family protein [Candidatus Gracilibacteria bacterium]NUJ98592.1 peptidoglycan bridge formation glycyltransferase FemA/FemB family protein [Candidatus Gracilibacteria bacterium]
MAIWQTKAWGEMLKNSGQAKDIFEIDEIFVEKRKISFGKYGLFVIGLDKNITEETRLKLQALCKQEKALFIQIETIFYDKKIEFLKGKTCQTGYYKKFIPPFTAVIDLKKSEEEIFADMKPKGRYNIRLAEKKGVECHVVEKNEKNITDFFSLMQETCSRDNFAGNTLTYYKYFLEKIQGSELISASFEGKIIASGIFVFDTEVSFYYYGASSNTYRNLMAPYLLQWTVIQEAKKRRSKIYDFLGIASPGEKNSPLAGVTEFKTKLSQDTRKVSESFIFVENKVMYFLIMGLRKLKN